MTSDDIRRVAESAMGQRFNKANYIRWFKRNAVISARRERKLMAEQERHFKAIRDMDDECRTAMEASREAHYAAEHEFFRKQLSEGGE